MYRRRESTGGGEQRCWPERSNRYIGASMLALMPAVRTIPGDLATGPRRALDRRDGGTRRPGCRNGAPLRCAQSRLR